MKSNNQVFLKVTDYFFEKSKRISTLGNNGLNKRFFNIVIHDINKMTEWKGIYELYRKLKTEWKKYKCKADLDTILTHGDPQQTLRTAQLFESTMPNSETIKEALQIKQCYQEAAKDPFRHHDDVYQTALFMILDPVKKKNWNCFWRLDDCHVYRGQRNNTWSVIPTLLRENSSQDQIKTDLDRLASFCRNLNNKNPNYTDDQYLAIAQHYSGEAKVKTWLVDFTYSPLIALFFASLNGQEGQKGTVICISLGEWEKLSAGGKNPLYGIKRINISSVPRIKTQEATFLETHPDLIKQYVAHGLTFHQKAGLVFEDPVIGVTEQNLLYAHHDQFLSFAQNWESNSLGTTSFSLKRQSYDFKPLTVDDYLSIVNSWCENKIKKCCVFDDEKEKLKKTYNTDEIQSLLEKLCNFHLLLQREYTVVNIATRSLHRLEDAVDSILFDEDDRPKCLKDVICPDLGPLGSQYMIHANEEGRKAIKKIVSAVDK